MNCTNEQLIPKCDGQFKKAIKVGHIECAKCGYRIKGEMPTEELSQTDAPKTEAKVSRSKTSTISIDKEN